MGIDKVNKAIFLDRDGVINKLVFNKLLNEFEPPHNIKELILFDWTLGCLKRFQENEYLLFIVSNQPDYAKGKTSLENLFSVHIELNRIFELNKLYFKEYYYCYHHPEGIIPEYSIKCDCRKPSNKNVLDAINKYSIDVKNSWFIGDRESDIICGKNSGLKTIFINENKIINKLADFNVENLKEAAVIILQFKN